MTIVALQLNAHVILQMQIFNISAALSKSAGLFKIPKGEWRRPQGNETSLEIPLDFPC